MIVHSIAVGLYQANCYILADEDAKQAVIIDPGDDYPSIHKALISRKLVPAMVVNTHGHIDHIGANSRFQVPIYIHEDDRGFLTDPAKNLSNFLARPYVAEGVINSLHDADTFGPRGVTLRVIHTPGHTPGGICLSVAGMLFTGDTLFKEGIGRADFPGSSHKQLIRSIREKLFVLPDETIVYPGHGPMTTIGAEKKDSPFLDEVYERFDR